MSADKWWLHHNGVSMYGRYALVEAPTEMIGLIRYNCVSPHRLLNQNHEIMAKQRTLIVAMRRVRHKKTQKMRCGVSRQNYAAIPGERRVFKKSQAFWWSLLLRNGIFWSCCVPVVRPISCTRRAKIFCWHIGTFHHSCGQWRQENVGLFAISHLRGAPIPE